MKTQTADKSEVNMAEYARPGALVKLKSGGPTMTVEGYYLGWVRCSWFNGTTKKEADFDLATLVPATLDNPSR